MYNANALPPDLLDELRALLGDRLSTGLAVREHHGRDESSHPAALPDAVVWPETTEEVSTIARLCHAFRVPMIPFGVGSSLEGHVIPLHGGVSIDLSHMNRILALHVEDLDATVQAGVTRKQLNAWLHDSGLFFPIDPGADATLGGMTATRASGTNAVRYGSMREAVLALTVVLADGRVIHTGTRARKSAAGYDLTRLFVGSEGTLGIVTEITVRLHPHLEAISAAVCGFPDVASAARTVIQTIQTGVPVARAELLDALSMRAINAHSKTNWPEVPTLFFEFHGTEAGVAEQAETVQALAHEHGGTDFRWATRQEERTQLWAARHDAYFACLQLRPGSRSLTTDVCVPISRLAECIEATAADVAGMPMPVPLLGHVGDGNFHLLVLTDHDSAAEREAAHALSHRLVLRALAMGGTCTGEHGVGFGKMGYLAEEHGEALDVMRAIKHALDPYGLMNPGKIVETEPQDARR
ncbi:MAG TPA: FAD-linked oxidase C-terminal domain-containing protein [Plasticicumulans sp.]|nr:FAD-linked oxidase C-terminal domain-containing protein [Plasticicumulans sp.]